jgi:hypothetical protein
MRKYCINGLPKTYSILKCIKNVVEKRIRMCPGLLLRIIGKIYQVQMGEFIVNLSPGKVNIF